MSVGYTPISPRHSRESGSLGRYNSPAAEALRFPRKRGRACDTNTCWEYQIPQPHLKNGSAYRQNRPTLCQLAGDKGERPAWQITRGKRSQDHHQVRGLRRRQCRKTGIAALPVHHPRLDDELRLVVSRPGKGRKPWYLLANEPIGTPDDAWRVVLAYARRWQVEMCYRACKDDSCLFLHPAPTLPANWRVFAQLHAENRVSLFSLYLVPGPRARACCGR